MTKAVLTSLAISAIIAFICIFSYGVGARNEARRAANKFKEVMDNREARK